MKVISPNSNSIAQKPPPPRISKTYCAASELVPFKPSCNSFSIITMVCYSMPTLDELAFIPKWDPCVRIFSRRFSCSMTFWTASAAAHARGCACIFLSTGRMPAKCPNTLPDRYGRVSKNQIYLGHHRQRAATSKLHQWTHICTNAILKLGRQQILIYNGLHTPHRGL